MKYIKIFFLLTIVSCNQGPDLDNKHKLDLSGRQLKSIPDSVFAMADLTYLDLGSSNAVFFPPLSALVDPKANSLTQLPQDIGKLKNLNTLILNSNRLSSLPSSITQLTKLEYLDLSLNKNLDILKELSKLKKLPNLKILKIAGMGPMNKTVIENIEKELLETKVVTSIVGCFDY